MLSITRLAAVVSLGFVALGSAAVSAEEARYNQIALRAEVSQEVAHDLMQVTLYSEAQHKDPAKLAADITTGINAALQQARKSSGVTISLGSRNSYPVYDDDQRISAWRERAELRLESADFATLSKLTGELLQQLKMGGMSFSVANPTQKKTEDALLQDAINAFKARAQLATTALGGKSYKLVSLSLNGGGFQPPQPMRMQMESMSMAKSAPTPEIEAGSSQVSVNADGVIEVQMP
ncbi:MAG: SIMPL domain-containing protein [Pseudomonas sp.]|uniref:SIMPL domain-containing protein n=1 Tax=Pseudomonas sp. TaxID=306 RepID=UPI002734C02A|nr:SIMPL domain-containing protein [Pseudomonas sp.]MDP3846333.1 SIMPL domain-containing protein [Pseudomonas sp.]